MSLIDGITASADWVAKDMEAMLRECDAVIASKDEHLARLAAGIEALRAEMDQISAERALTVADRDKAEQVLAAFRAAVKKGTGLRQSRGHARTWLRVVPDAPDPDDDVAAEDVVARSASAAAERREALADSPATTVEPEVAAIRVSGERSVAVMEIVTAEPDRGWTPKDIAVRLEGHDAGQEQAAYARARALLDSLVKRKVLHKQREGGNQRCVFRLAAAWEAA
ncbi:MULTISPECIES: hypothetical protein [Streptomyces]|uniref:Uncharacterized protein n=1 Tax=Streptomyces griseoruber TaxID=1943 RepID=A0A124I1T3_9ACTN|nr:hypothetical protein [Streptomyces griseoruber]KUN78526.1 hypothetical protein AQJ64_31650 [Streptomyces griseoruber]